MLRCLLGSVKAEISEKIVECADKADAKHTMYNDIWNVPKGNLEKMMKTLEEQVTNAFNKLHSIYDDIEHRINAFSFIMESTRRVAKTDLDNIRERIHRDFSHVRPAANGRDKIIAEAELFITGQHQIAMIAINDGGKKIFDYLFAINFMIVKGTHHDNDE